MESSANGTQVQSARAEVLRRLHCQGTGEAAWTMSAAVVGAILYVAISMVEMPYQVVFLFKLEWLPALALIAGLGAIRGSAAGFFAGYAGSLAHGMIAYGHVAPWTLPSAAIGAIGLVTGAAEYDFSSSMSRVKLSLVALTGLMFAVLLTTAVDLFVYETSAIAVLGFYTVPTLSAGIPSVTVLTPLVAGVWQVAYDRWYAAHL